MIYQIIVETYTTYIYSICCSALFIFIVVVSAVLAFLIVILFVDLLLNRIKHLKSDAIGGGATLPHEK